MTSKLAMIRDWLGSGSINIMGLPMAGKDTVGVQLAIDIGGKFLSSGAILRAYEAKHAHENLTRDGLLTPQSEFRRIVIPYLSAPELDGYPLVLSAVGRWDGEEVDVINALEDKHPLKAVILLNISEGDVRERWETAQMTGDRAEGDAGRTDDSSVKKLERRFEEFRDKTLPVLTFYKSLDILATINADQPKDAVYNELINKLADMAAASFLKDRLDDIDELEPEDPLLPPEEVAQTAPTPETTETSEPPATPEQP